MKIVKIMAINFLLLCTIVSFQNCTGSFQVADQLSGEASFNSETPVLPPVDEKDLLKWSDPATWGGALPKANDNIVIPSGKAILLDVDTPLLGTLTVNGRFIFDRKNIQLNAITVQINNTGTLEIGSLDQPFQQKAIITLSGDPKTNSSARGIFVNGGKVLIYGAVPDKSWTQINAHANAGSSTLQLKESVNWRAEDQIVVAPTDYNIYDSTELLAVKSLSGSVVTLKSPLAKFKWGLLQYPTSSGMSLTPDPNFNPPEQPFPGVLDERAEVGNLTRNVVIQSTEDSIWTNDGLGVHMMIMGLQSSIQISGLEIRRAGQSGIKTRYPIHWHMLSYDTASGALLGTPVSHYLKNSSIWNSMNRCVVIHGTNGLLIENNICYDIKGHAFFLEDAVERGNVLRGNLALKVKRPAAGKILLVHEGDVPAGGPTGFWLTNPDNIVTQNTAADTDGNGFWMAFPEKPLGLSKLVNIKPIFIKHGPFEGNVAHSVTKPGFLIGMVPADDLGNVSDLKYSPTTTGEAYDFTNGLQFELKRLVSYKNMEGAYRNRVTKPQYIEWVTADNVGRFFAGAVENGDLKRHLLVGKSLNDRNPYPEVYPYDPPSAFASYHSQLHFINNVIVNFPFTEGKNSGSFGTDDYYVSAVDKGTIRNPGNLLLKSHPGYRFLPVEYRNPPVANQHWTLAGAIWDPYGYVGIAGQYWVYDTPFFTSGKTCQYVLPAGQNSVSCSGEFFGVQNYWSDVDPHENEFKLPIQVIRQKTDGTVIGTWEVGDGNLSDRLWWMRHFAAVPGGEYILRFPGYQKPKQFAFTITNAFHTSDQFVIAIDYGGKDNPVVYTVSNFHRMGPFVPPPGSPSRRDMTKAASLAEVRSSNGDKYFIDRSQNLIWIKYVGGLTLQGDFSDPWSEDTLYKTHNIFIDGL